MSDVVGKAVSGASLDGTGRSAPLGATMYSGGVNFSVYSREASAVELLLFDQQDEPRRSRVDPGA